MEAHSFDVGWGRLSALHQPGTGEGRILCLHGWMDNAASFAPLAEQLPGHEIVALEFAGHGWSDHRPEGTHYYFMDYLFDLDRVLKELDWDQCILAGHSLGAGVASSYVAMAPERVERLILIDGIGPIPSSVEGTVKRLGKSLESVRKPPAHRKTYPDLLAAAKRRMGNNPMEEPSALALVERAMTESGDGYRWRTDPRLLWNSPVLPTEEQCQAMMSAISCPTLVLTTRQLEEWLGAYLAERIACLPNARHITVAGGHHTHLDDAATIAPHLLKFLEETGDLKDAPE